MSVPESTSYPGLKLLPQHEQLLHDSGIDPLIARHRGYQSVVDGDEEYLTACGFTEAQQQLPALLVPIHSVHGGEVPALHQLRPDNPRTDEKGNVIKYETAARATMVLDVNPWLRLGPNRILDNPKVPLLITEGARKVDGALSRNLLTIGLLGVANWRGTDKTTRGKRALSDFEALGLNGREVLLTFDSDIIYKKPVNDALERLHRYLQSFKANVYFVVLPEPTPGTKVGLDDYLKDHTTEQLLALKQRALPPFKTEQERSAEERAQIAADLDPGLVEPLAAIDALPEPPEYNQLLGPIETVAKALAQIVDPTRRALAVAETEKRLRMRGLSQTVIKSLIRVMPAPKGAPPSPPVMDPAEREQRLAELREQAAEVLAHPDPLALIEDELPHVGYGGDPAAVLVGILSMTSRALQVFTVPGAAVGHLQYEGASSAGKTFIVMTARRFLPPEAWREVGGSTKSLIYTEGSFAHCVLFFPEMDSIPKGGGTDDQNVVASAVRGLLSEHRLKYQVTVRRPEEEGGGFVTQQIDLPGPTTLITTGLGKLEKQYATRTFTYKVNVDVDELMAKLKKAGQNEAHRNTREPRPALIALQGLIQLLAPWDVWIPFADQLANYAARSAESKTLGPRVLRDINKIFAFIKVMCVLNHAHRSQDAEGRWIAEPADYARVYQLIGGMYQEATSGVTARTRQVVETVKALCERYQATRTQNPAMPIHWGPNAKEVAEALNLSQNSVSEPINLALTAGWLVDLESETGLPRASRRPFKLNLGDPLPAVGGLLPPELIAGDDRVIATKSAGTAVGFTITPHLPGSGGGVIANAQETQAENETFKRSTDVSGNGRPVREPIRVRVPRTPIR